MGKMSAKQHAFGKKTEKALLEKVAKCLENAINLKENGQEAEAEALLEDIRFWLEEKANEGDMVLKKSTVEPVREVVFPGKGEIVVEGNNVILGVIKEEEKEKYLAVSEEYSFAKGMYKDEKFCEYLWEEFISEQAFVCSIYEKNSGEYVGYCSIKDMKKKEWELSIELCPDKCHKGYGSEALKLLMESVYKLSGRQYFRVRVELDNHASQGLMKKLGATPNGISEFLLHGEEIDKFQAENIDMITDEIRAVAEDFCMDAEDLLGYVLEYRLKVDSI